MYKIYYEPDVTEVTAGSIIRVDSDNELYYVWELAEWRFDVLDSFENTYYVMPQSKLSKPPYSFAKHKHIHEDSKYVNFDDLITIVYTTFDENFNQSKYVKTYSLPRNFGEKTIELFEQRLEMVYEKKDIEEISFFLNGYIVFTIKNLQSLYKYFY